MSSSPAAAAGAGRSGRALRVLRAAVAAATVLAVALPSGSSAAGTQGFTWSGGDCKEVVVELSLPATKLQRLLPRGYTVEEGAPGSGRLLLGMVECGSLTVQGVEQPRDATADAIVPALTARGAPVSYHLWQVTGAPALRQRMARLGMRGGLEPRAAARSTLVAAAGTGTADVPWSFAPHAVSAAAAKVLPPHSGTVSWVQVTRRGTVETRLAFEDYRMYLGVGRVTAPAGSWLATLIGGTSAQGVGVLTEPFDAVAKVTLRPGR